MSNEVKPPEVAVLAKGRGIPSKSKSVGWEASPAGALKTTLVLLIAITVGDAIMPPTIPIAVLFIMPVLTSVWVRKRRVIISTAVIATILTLGNLELADERFDKVHTVASAGASIFILWTTVSMGFMWLAVQRELVRTQRTTRKTLTNLAEGVVTIDQDDRIVLMNPAAERMTGWELRDAKGRAVDEVVRRERDVILIPGDGVPPGQGEVLISRSGEASPVEVTMAEFDIDDETSGSVLVITDASERRDREGVMLRLAYRDRLTGLPNRASLTDRMDLEFAHARRAKAKLGMLFLDLDGLKMANDTHGHKAGDAMLVGFAERLRSVLREGDTVARLGGDEFTVLLPDLDSQSNAGLIADKVLIALEKPILHEGKQLWASASIGVAVFPQDGDSGEQLLERADEAMYQAKQAGGAQYCYWGAKDRARV
ncbi:MAG: diguanylate cyclase (GGDEF)-like protein/PAS domain S-box-containing protein [Planctomycetota bacterium]|jgi:diguanylate cyclase (GGDEF)-like protein/PAS domain S-box-containing protein